MNQTSPFAHLAHQRAILLITFRKNGSPVGTPVSVAVDGNRAYFRTWHTAWKVRRLQNNPSVELVPSTMKGKPTGPSMEAHARRVEGAEAKHARKLLARKYPLLHRILVPVGHRLMRYKTLHYELKADRRASPK